MIRNEKSANGNVATFVLSGRMQEEDPQALRTVLKNHKKRSVVLHLEEVKLATERRSHFWRISKQKMPE